jgi:hypothetical protein
MVMMRTMYAGPRGCYRPGEIVSFPEDMEKDLVDGRYAEYVEETVIAKPEPVKVERAVIGEPEQATAPPQRRRRKEG